MGSASLRRSIARAGVLALVTVVASAITITSVFAVAPPRLTLVRIVSGRPAAGSSPSTAAHAVPGYLTVAAPRIGRDTLPAGWQPPTPLIVHSIPYGPASWEKLDLYLPDARRFPGVRPVILYMHSGGWVAYSRLITTPVVQREVMRGYAVASIEYALAPAHPFPAPLQDVKLAIRWAKTVGAFFRLDPHKVMVAGGSAGGHLATLAAVTPGRFEPAAIPAPLARADDTVAAVLDFVGPTDLVAFDHEGGDPTVAGYARHIGAALLACANPPLPAPLRCPAGRERAASVAPYVSNAAPPIFMAYGGTDTLVPPATQAVPLARLWAAHRGTNAVWLEIMPREGHNVGVDQLNNTALDQFLDGVVRGSIH
jgi:acetyl esterase/lipase